MKIEIKLFAALSVGRFKAETQEFAAETCVEQVVKHLGFAEGDVGIVLINGKHATTQDSLNDGDVLSLLPLMDGG
jgi:sulfur-carrier protein